MKKIYVAVCLMLITCLSACVDLDETYDFHADGSCNVTYNFDMSRAVSVLANLLPDSVKQSPQFDKVQDTTVNYYSILPDSLHQQMDSTQIEMAKKSDLVLKLNMKRNLVRISMRHSADNVTDLDYYLKNVSKMTSGNQLSSILPAKKIKNAGNTQLTLNQDYYNYEITAHKFYRSIDTARFNKYLRANSSMFSMSKAMLIDMPYKVTLNFPRPVNRIDNTKAIISADRKSIILEANIEEVVKNPSVMNFKIDF